MSTPLRPRTDPRVFLVIAVCGCLAMACGNEDGARGSVDECAEMDEFNNEIAKGAGHATPEVALDEFLQFETVRGEPVLDEESENRVTWALVEDGVEVGELMAEQTSPARWNLMSGSWCFED